jgi:UDP-2,3-diacylglucosamine pyrophosphatase LpxH
MSSTHNRAKRIFISDLHMSDAESFNPPDKLYPYAWLRRDHLKMLADFLQKKVIEDSEVKELVILGDLFDQWVYPAELKPPPTADEYFQGIFDAKQNHDVIEKLEKIATDGRLIYVPGNHDMLLTKEFLECHFPGVI